MILLLWKYGFILAKYYIVFFSTSSRFALRHALFDDSFLYTGPQNGTERPQAGKGTREESLGRRQGERNTSLDSFSFRHFIFVWRERRNQERNEKC